MDMSQNRRRSACPKGSGGYSYQSIEDYISENYDSCRRVVRTMLVRFGLHGEVLTQAVDAVLERAVANKDTYCPQKGEPLQWLIGIARNYSVDHFRSVKNAPQMVWIDEPGIAKSLPTIEDPARAYERQRLVERLTAAVDALPKGQRDAVRFCDLDEVPHEDAAAQMGIPVRRLRQWLYEGRDALGRIRELRRLYYGSDFSWKEARSRKGRNRGNDGVRG
ncbi:MAG TPA: RNA polymerase sigma factor [bacterium]|nr:RNA polymerase sigma factor [bacterium]